MEVAFEVMRIDHRGLLDAFDVGNIVMRLVTGPGEMPGDLQKAEAHQVRAQRDAQIDYPLGDLKVRRS